MGDAAHAMVPFYGQGMNCVSAYDQYIKLCCTKYNGGNNFETFDCPYR